MTGWSRKDNWGAQAPRLSAETRELARQRLREAPGRIEEARHWSVGLYFGWSHERAEAQPAITARARVLLEE